MGLEKIPNKLIDLSFPRKNYASLDSIEYSGNYHEMPVGSELQQRDELCVPISCILYLFKTRCYNLGPSSRS